MKPSLRHLTRRQVLLAAAGFSAVGCVGRIETQGSGTPPPEAPTREPSDPAPLPSPDATTPEPTTPDPNEPPTPRSYRGRVVEVKHAGAMSGNTAQDLAVSDMLTRALLELTGASCETDAWKTFFGPGDVVGIKVNPVGFPEAYSHAATLKAIIRGLELAGVARSAIVVFDRYRDMLDAVGYPAELPAGIRFEGIVPTYTDEQTGMAGYDASAFVEFSDVWAGNDPTDPQKRRSYVADLVQNQLTKIVNVPALKDHVSAGVTCSLKNMTYGMMNNVSRTHQGPGTWTKDFIPAAASLPTIRNKVVLHVCDALRVGYEGGPSADAAHTKTYDALLVAADPVALDRVGWSIIDDMRTQAGMAVLANSGTKLVNGGHEAFEERQPEHVLAAGAAGLGEADLAKIQRKTINI